MVKGLFIPMPKEPQLKDFDYNYAKFGEAYKNGKNICQKMRKKILLTLLKIRHLKTFLFSWCNFRSSEFLRVQVKYSKGFRAPTSDELYFTFKHPDFTILPNPVLKPEEAKIKRLH